MSSFSAWASVMSLTPALLAANLIRAASSAMRRRVCEFGRRRNGIALLCLRFRCVFYKLESCVFVRNMHYFLHKCMFLAEIMGLCTHKGAFEEKNMGLCMHKGAVWRKNAGLCMHDWPFEKGSIGPCTPRWVPRISKLAWVTCDVMRVLLGYMTGKANQTGACAAMDAGFDMETEGPIISSVGP